MQGIGVRSLVGKLRSGMPHSSAKKKKIKPYYCFMFYSLLHTVSCDPHNSFYEAWAVIISTLCRVKWLTCGFPGGSGKLVKNLPAMHETWVQSLGRKILWWGDGKPPQYSCLRNPTDRGAWQATVHGVAKESDTTEWLTHLIGMIWEWNDLRNWSLEQFLAYSVNTQMLAIMITTMTTTFTVIITT